MGSVVVLLYLPVLCAVYMIAKRSFSEMEPDFCLRTRTVPRVRLGMVSISLKSIMIHHDVTTE